MVQLLMEGGIRLLATSLLVLGEAVTVRVLANVIDKAQDIGHTCASRVRRGDHAAH